MAAHAERGMSAPPEVVFGGDLPDDQLAQLADESLARFAEHVDDNLTAG